MFDLVDFEPEEVPEKSSTHLELKKLNPGIKNQSLLVLYTGLGSLLGGLILFSLIATVNGVVLATGSFIEAILLAMMIYFIAGIVGVLTVVALITFLVSLIILLVKLKRR
jgi:hypothetical protein